MTRIRLGVIGLGAMGSEMLRVAKEHPEYDVVVAADADPDARERAQRTHRGLRVVTSADDVLAAALDAVYVATPPRTHAGLVLPALERSLAVFCEKPLAIDLADGELLASAAATARVATGVNFALSDRAAVLEVERALAAGEVGKPRSVEVRLAFPDWPRAFQADATWLAEAEQGGFLREVFSHFAYLTDRILGDLTPAWQEVSRPRPDAAETAAVGLFVAGGVPVRVWAESGSARPEIYEWTLHGSKRSYRLTDWGDLATSTGGSWEPAKVAGERGSEHTRLSAFAAAVRGEPTTNLADFPTALRVQRVVEGWLRNPAPSPGR
ncbi:MAG: Gfo/Idh/MocA family protein [Nocardioidaceae bacterium]